MYHRWHAEINSTVIVRHYKSVQVIACSCMEVSGCNSEDSVHLSWLNTRDLFSFRVTWMKMSKLPYCRSFEWDKVLCVEVNTPRPHWLQFIIHTVTSHSAVQFYTALRKSNFVMFDMFWLGSVLYVLTVLNIVSVILICLVTVLNIALGMTKLIKKKKHKS